MKGTTGNSQILNLALIIAVIGLVALIIYGNRFRQSPRNRQPTIEKPVKINPGQEKTVATSSGTKRPSSPERPSPYTLAPTATSPLEGATHPKKNIAVTNRFTGTPDDPVAFKKIIKSQTRELSRESAAQGTHPNEKRALALPPERIRALEKSGRLIY